MKKIAMMLALCALSMAANSYACDSSHPHQSKTGTSTPATPAPAK